MKSFFALVRPLHCLIAALVAVAPLPLRAQEEPADELAASAEEEVPDFETAKALVADGRLVEGLDMLEEIVLADREHFEALILLAENYDPQIHRRQAIAAYEQALSLKRATPALQGRMHAALANLHYMEGPRHFDEAVAHWDAAIRLRDHLDEAANGSIFSAYGHALLSEGEEERALGYLRLAAEKYGSDSAAATLRFDVLWSNIRASRRYRDAVGTSSGELREFIDVAELERRLAGQESEKQEQLDGMNTIAAERARRDREFEEAFNQMEGFDIEYADDKFGDEAPEEEEAE